MANKWFEETFLPSIEARMNNPKYPNQAIISEKQGYICEKYMKPTNPDCITYFYNVGTKHYSMHRAGRYTFLSMHDDSKAEWYIKDNRSQEDIATFKTEREMQDWIDENVDEETGSIKGREKKGWHWTSGMRYTA